MAKALGILQFQSMAAAAAQALTDAIITGELKPGQRLVEQKLATSMGIGQPTIREALMELEHKGFVRKIPNKGSYVTELSQEDFEKSLEVRLVLESRAIERAATRITPEAVAELEATVARMEESASHLDRVSFHETDLAFHQIIWKLADNAFLEAALERVAFALFAFVLLSQEQPEFLAAARQHRDILEGLKSGDPEEGKQVFVASTVQFWKQYHGVDLDQYHLTQGSRSEQPKRRRKP